MPRRLLKNAKEATDVQPLMDAFTALTEENYTPEMVDILLHHLNPERMIVPEAPIIAPWTPGSGLPPIEQRYLDQLRQQEAWSQIALYCSAEGLFMIQVRCPDHLREETTQRIALHLDDILSWFKYFQSSTFPLQDPRSRVFVGDPTKPCEAIWQLFDSKLSKLDFKPRLLLSMDTIIDFTFSAWLATDSRIGHRPFNIRCWAYNRMAGPGECPIMELVIAFLEVEDYQQKIFESLVETRGLLNRVIKSAISRCEFVFDVEKPMVEQELEMCRFKGHSPMVAMLTYLQRTLDAMQRLCEHPVVSEKVFKSDFFEHVCRAANRWLSQSDANSDSKERLLAFQIARLCQAILVVHRHISELHWKAYSRALESLMRGAYLDVVVAALQSPLREGRDMGNEMLGLLQVQCDVRSSSSKAIRLKLKELPPTSDPTRSGPHRNDQASGYWLLLKYDSESAGTYSKGATSSICDNLSCPGNRPNFARSRECSTCHSVLYCSNECQREDWVALHRQECPHARAHMIEDARQNKPHYSLSMRLFQGELITRRARIAFGASRISNPAWMNRKIDETPVVVELAPAVNPRFEFHTTNDYLRLRRINSPPDPKAPASPSTRPYLDNRIEAMVKAFDITGVRAGVRIVEDVCQFGDKRFHVLAKFQKRSPDKPYHLVHCVSRVQHALP